MYQWICWTSDGWWNIVSTGRRQWCQGNGGYKMNWHFLGTGNFLFHCEPGCLLLSQQFPSSGTPFAGDANKSRLPASVNNLGERSQDDLTPKVIIWSRHDSQPPAFLANPICLVLLLLWSHMKDGLHCCPNQSLYRDVPNACGNWENAHQQLPRTYFTSVCLLEFKHLFHYLSGSAYFCIVSYVINGTCLTFATNHWLYIKITTAGMTPTICYMSKRRRQTESAGAANPPGLLWSLQELVSISQQLHKELELWHVVRLTFFPRFTFSPKNFVINNKNI